MLFFGILLVIIGLVLLGQNVGLLPDDVGTVLWPAILVALGISFLLKKGDHWCGWWCKCDNHKK